MMLAAIQAILSFVFLAAFFLLNILPMKYLAVLGVILFLALLIVFASQLLARGKGIAGKLYSIFMSAVMVMGIFYLFKTYGLLDAITGGGIKIDKMVVAVLAEDPAETIQDAASYNFGVQYVQQGDTVQKTVDAVNEELGSSIVQTEYSSVQEQAAALQDGQVQAMIYNEAYNDLIEEQFPDFSSRIKVIYTHTIISKMDNTAENIHVDRECFTVYVSGIDVYGPIETNSRSDVNIILVVNPVTHQILQVTTPRDYYVEIPGISEGQRDKLTHAGIYGVDVSMATLEALYGIDLDFYARVNFTSVVDIVNALGGIDVYSEQEFTTNDGMYVQAGMNHFDGEEALAFSRERYHVDGGDFQRGKNQQAVITAMIQKAASPAILMGASGIMSGVSGNVDTNMSQKQIQTLIRSQLNSGADWNIVSMAAEGTGDEQYCYSSPGSLLYVAWPQEESISEIKAAMEAVQRGEALEN